MTISAYVIALNLSALPIDYEWDTVWFNTFWAVSDEDNPRMANALQLVAAKAAFALGVACTEWVIARVEGHTDTTDAIRRLEAARMAAIDPRYASLPAPPPNAPSAPNEYASPLRLTMKLIAYAHEHCTGDGEGVRSSTQGLAMLADHLVGRHPAYAPWLSESLRRCHEHYPVVDATVEDEPQVPLELFNPDFIWTQAGAQHAIESFVSSVDPAGNPYLRSPEEILASGFKGVPYGRGK